MNAAGVDGAGRPWVSGWSGAARTPCSPGGTPGGTTPPGPPRNSPPTSRRRAR
ncbi:hypothetical protein NKH77_25235 [Streptomyces sp. M19]